MDYPQQKQSKILVIGETCIDRYVEGSCDRISPEAPVPILSKDNTFTRHGMATNVATNINTLGQQTCLITNSSRIIKTRYIDKKTKQQILRVDENDKCQPISDSDLLPLENDSYEATVISDYNKGFLTNEQLLELIDKLPKPIFVDTKKKDLSPFRGCIIKINESESKLVYNKPEDSELIVTLGSRGAKYRGEILPTLTCEVTDVCGAGDTFLASLAVHYCQYKNMRDAIKFANKCARIAVQRLGVYSVTLEDLNEIRN